MEAKYAIHPAANSFPMMDEQRFSDLKDDISKHGQRVPITLCDGKVLDGRNRLKACTELNMKPRTINYEGNPYDYVWSLNGNRRDLVADQRYLIWKYCNEHSEEWKSKQDRIKQQANAKRSEAAKKQHQVSNPRVGEKSGISTNCANTKNHEKGQNAKAAASNTNRGSVARGDKLAKSHPDLADKVRTGEMTPADAHREAKRRDVIAKLEDTKAKEVKAAEGLYDVIVIDPPWLMQKIERDVRTQQVEFDYPTMTEKELELLSIPAADDCHVWVWTTHKFLPMALRLINRWGLTYVCTFVWHKPGGFQPYGLPQYNCEFALYCRKGSPSFIDTKQFPVAFNAKRTKHSEKPELFYEVIRHVTAGRRVDMFSRRPIDGFDAWGNES